MLGSFLDLFAEDVDFHHEHCGEKGEEHEESEGDASALHVGYGGPGRQHVLDCPGLSA